MSKFSVIIPLYNKENYIRKTLFSALNQNFSDLEIFVIDDGSTDNSLNKISDINDPRLNIITQENSGVSAARNRGIKEATSKYISFLDADDYWHPDYLKTINGLVEKFSESDIYVTAYRVILGENKIKYSSDTNKIIEGCVSSYWNTLDRKYDFVWTSASTVTKESIVKAGFFNEKEKIGEDLDLFSRIAQNNPKVAYSTKKCVDYNRNAENNARVSNSIAYPKSFLETLKKELNNNKRTEKERLAIKTKYNKKMIAYIFSLIRSENYNRANKELKNWTTQGSFPFKVLLKLAKFIPKMVIELIYKIRLKIF